MKILVVTNPFGGKEVGDQITDLTEIEAVMAGEHAHDVVQANGPDEPKPTTKKES